MTPLVVGGRGWVAFSPQISEPVRNEGDGAGVFHQLENPRVQAPPTRGTHSTLLESHAAENLPAHFTSCSQCAIGTGNSCLGLIKLINKM